MTGTIIINNAQHTALRSLSERYGVAYNPDDFAPQFDLPIGYVAGWIGGSRRLLFVGCDPNGEISS